jgi:bifunctional UDP-N-acetylglucosamine pyrophosphorylase/glucosamine-1-phosphate N-acetyltransferase
LGDGCLTAAGTTITQDIPPQALALARVPQVNKEGAAERMRAKQKGCMG